MGRPRDSAQLHDSLERFFALTREDQLEHIRIITDWLAQTHRPETDDERQRRRQAETLNALRLVQTKLQLTANRAPTADQFDQVAKELGLGEDRSSVRRAHGTWSAATATLTGGSPVETAAQKHIRGQLARPQRTRVAHIEGIARWLTWLDSLPGKLPERYQDCLSYVAEHNATAPPDDLMVGPGAALNAFPLLTWNELKRAARGQLDPYDLHRQRVAELADKARFQPLVSLREIAALLGNMRTAAGELVDDPGFPASVATLSGRRVWRTRDVLAHIAGAEQSGALDETTSLDDEELLDTAALSGIVLAGPDVLLKYLSKEQWHHLVPRPTGKVGGVHYWTRSDVERWLSSPGGAKAMSRRRSRRSAG